MCGIAGLYYPAQPRPVDPGRVGRMIAALAHRGPDGEGVWTAPGVGFGHRRLSIIDVAGSPQPMADGELVVTYNGEIYNFAELRAELQAGGARFATGGDTEVLLHGWRAWGPAMLPRLHGMFAFAIHDARRHCLFLARDRLGVKPLHLAAKLVDPPGQRIERVALLERQLALGSALGRSRRGIQRTQRSCSAGGVELRLSLGTGSGSGLGISRAG